MNIEKYIICNCGKKKRIHWTGLSEFKRGEVTFCAGASECKKCGVLQSHYSGNPDDIMEFVSFMESQYSEHKVH